METIETMETIQTMETVQIMAANGTYTYVCMQRQLRA